MQNDKTLETKQKLSQALVKMMYTKPISKITVTAIVAKCGLNRKTFYYHFIDIYDLFEYTINQDILNELESLDLITNLSTAIRMIIRYINKNKRLIINVINDVRIDEIKLFFKNNFNKIIRKYIEELIQVNQYKISNEFKEYSISTISAVVASAVYSWIIHYYDYDEEKIVANTTFIFETALNSVLEKANNVK